MSSLESRPKSCGQTLSISSAAVGKESWEKTGHFAFKCYIRNKSFQPVQSLALLDSGASAYGFVDTKFAHTNNLDLVLLTRPRYLRVFDGSETSAGKITHVAKTKLEISGHTETMVLFVTTLAYFDIVLGLPWLQQHNPEINWPEGSLVFNQTYCRKHSTSIPVCVKAVSPDVVAQRRLRCESKKLQKVDKRAETCDAQEFEELVTKEDGISLESIQLRSYQRNTMAT